MNGNAAGDPDGQYAFESEQGNSVIDYVLLDHCDAKCKKSKKEHRTVFRWDPDKADLFSEAVSSNIFKEKLTEASKKANLLNQSVESAIKTVHR